AGEVLAAVDEEALHHHADDRGLACGHLRGDVARDDGLAAVVLAAVAVAAIDHQPWRQSPAVERRGRLTPACRLLSPSRLSAAQDHVAVGIPARGDDRAERLLGHTQEAKRVRTRARRVDGDLYVTVRAVLEADRHRQARRELAMDLALRRARADRAPRHDV